MKHKISSKEKLRIKVAARLKEKIKFEKDFLKDLEKQLNDVKKKKLTKGQLIETWIEFRHNWE